MNVLNEDIVVVSGKLVKLVKLENCNNFFTFAIIKKNSIFLNNHNKNIHASLVMF